MKSKKPSNLEVLRNLKNVVEELKKKDREPIRYYSIDEASKIAKKKGYNWIVKDACDRLIATKYEPLVKTYDNGICELLNWYCEGKKKFIGIDNGSDWWLDIKINLRNEK